ncbi:MAG: aspartyl/glutamyl-tRNA amidotransferase subunit C [Candidatus Shapirobacteria bacterium]|nr:aspartyl/glutamyl-tRNA amidotransferase subunit C [Candidatus Shapirobacteria bacterium]
MDKRSISVDHLEKLANLKVDSRQKKEIGPQLEKTVDYFSVLDQIAGLDQEEPTFQITDNTNITAQDSPEPCLPRKKILPKNKKYFIADND